MNQLIFLMGDFDSGARSLAIPLPILSENHVSPPLLGDWEQQMIMPRRVRPSMHDETKRMKSETRHAKQIEQID